MSRGHHGRCNRCGTRLQTGAEGKLICPKESNWKSAGQSGLGAPIWPFTARYRGLKEKS